MPEFEQVRDDGGQWGAQLQECIAPPEAADETPAPVYASCDGGGSTQSMVDLFGHYADDGASSCDASSSGLASPDSSGRRPRRSDGSSVAAPGADWAEDAASAGICAGPGDEGAEGAGPGTDPAPIETNWLQRAKDFVFGGWSSSGTPEQDRTPPEMTPAEKEADKQAKLAEFAKQSPEEKEKRWAQNDGKLSKEAWANVEKEKDPVKKKQAMLQAGIEGLDYDDPRRAQLEKIKSAMNGKDFRAGGAYTPGTAQTGCGGTADDMLRNGGDPRQSAFPGYFKGGQRELPGTRSPRPGDVYELQNPNGDIHGHAGTFCVSSPDGKTWLTYDGGQQARTADKELIKLVMRNVSVDSQGRTIVSGPDSTSGTAADNIGRPLSGTYDYQKMYDKYPALRSPATNQ